jgi:CTP:molybdopterin cytidylyltransferase MocA
LRHLGRSQHTARAMREQHAQVAVALLGDAPQVAAVARAVLAWRLAKTNWRSGVRPGSASHPRRWPPPSRWL